VDRDLQRRALGVGASVDALRDGKIDAFVWSGGVPTGSLLDLASTPGRQLVLVPHGEVLDAMEKRWPSLYHVVPIAKDAYPGLAAPVNVIGVAIALVADARLSDDLVFEITRALFVRKADLVAIHAEAANLEPSAAIVGSPAPFHEGAIRYYREVGVWKDGRP
jgi:TRAP transporter TAXI family solute receptor